MPIQWSGTITSPQQLAGVIQGESSTPAGQFAVASVMYNRIQNGGFGAGIMGVVTPTQFNGYQTPGANALALAGDLWSGNPPQGGSTGNALYFANPNGSTASWPSTLPGSGAVNIGGNWFSDAMGPPSANFSAPQYGGTQTTLANGPADASSGDGFGGVLSLDPSQPNYGDITGLPVAGVNAPMPSAPMPSAPASGTNAPNASTSTAGDAGQGTPVTQGLQQGTIAAIQGWIANIEQSFSSGLKHALSAAETAIGTYFSGVENWFIRFGLIVLAIVLIAIGLIVIMWDHGGQETAGRMMEVAAA